MVSSLQSWTHCRLLSVEGAKHLFAAENNECVMSETQAYSTGAVGCGGCVGWVCVWEGGGLQWGSDREIIQGCIKQDALQHEEKLSIGIVSKGKAAGAKKKWITTYTSTGLYSSFFFWWRRKANTEKQQYCYYYDISEPCEERFQKYAHFWPPSHPQFQIVMDMPTKCYKTAYRSYPWGGTPKEPQSVLVSPDALNESLSCVFWKGLLWEQSFTTIHKILQKPNSWTGLSPCIKESCKVKSLLQCISFLCPSFVTCFRSEEDHNLQSRGGKQFLKFHFILQRFPCWKSFPEQVILQIWCLRCITQFCICVSL